MKRTITEFFIEVEETIAVRQTAKTGNAEIELQPGNDSSICPNCGQAMPENKKSHDEEEKKNES